MDVKRFELLVEERFNKIRDVMTAKNEEYARGGDKLSNFKKAAAMDGVTPEAALKGMWKKHVISISDFIDDIERGVFHRPEKWEEKLTDNIAYLLLLEALLVERYSNTHSWTPIRHAVV